ncbi:MAG: bifunctional diguanylate cyclase/phosphodiesterase [Cyanobacteria bacterium J06635_1]
MPIERQRWSLVSRGTLFAISLSMGGWAVVSWQSYRLEKTTVQAYQQAEVASVQKTAQAAQKYIDQELAHRGTKDLSAIKHEVHTYFVEPMGLDPVGHPWIYAVEDATGGSSEDGADEFAHAGKSMAAISSRQQSHPPHEIIVQSIRSGRAGTSHHKCDPHQKGHQFVPWWEPLTQDASYEVAAWAPVVILPDTSHERVWMIGVSAHLTELMQLHGAYRQINAAILTMVAITFSTVGILLKQHWRDWHTYSDYPLDKPKALLLGQGWQSQPKQNHLSHLPLKPLSDSLGQASMGQASIVKAVKARDAVWVSYLRQVWSKIAKAPPTAYEVALEELVFTDLLTGLANRYQLYQVGAKVLADWSYQNAGIALLCIDLNQFKAVNDEFGHDAGDTLLVEVGHRLKSCLRDGDLLARLGGDEFAILLCPADTASVHAVANQVVQALEKPFYLNLQKIKMGGSVGIALTTESGLSIAQLLTQADIALYRAKASPGPFILFDRTMQAAVVARSVLERDLHEALGNQELCLHYQPIVDLHTQTTAGFEALVRWQHPQRGLLAPKDFLRVADDMGLSILIDRWVLNQACQQLTYWHPRHLDGQTPVISVNLTGRHFAQADLVNYVERLLSQHDINPQQLTLEITEHVMISQPEQVVETLHRLRELGLRVSLDDFGTGYSSLNYLNQLPVDFLKIDRSFVSKLEDSSSNNGQNNAIIKTIIRLAQDLEINTVAEGIETRLQLHRIKAMNCQYGQGDFFSKPLTRVAADQLLHHQVDDTEPQMDAADQNSPDLSTDLGQCFNKTS